MTCVNHNNNVKDLNRIDYLIQARYPDSERWFLEFSSTDYETALNQYELRCQGSLGLQIRMVSCRIIWAEHLSNESTFKEEPYAPV